MLKCKLYKSAIKWLWTVHHQRHTLGWERPYWFSRPILCRIYFIFPESVFTTFKKKTKFLSKNTIGQISQERSPFHIFMLIFCLASRNANGSQPQNWRICFYLILDKIWNTPGLCAGCKGRLLRKWIVFNKFPNDSFA